MIGIGGGAIGERHATAGTRSSHWLLLEVTYCDWLYSVVTVEFYFNVNWHNFVPFLLFFVYCLAATRSFALRDRGW